MGFYRWNRVYLRSIFAGMIFISGCISTALNSPQQRKSHNQTSLQPNAEYHKENSSQKSKPLLERFKADCKNWPSALVKSGRETFLATENMIALFLAGGMSVAMHQNVDTEIAEHFEEHRKLRNLRDEGLNFIGHPTIHFVATGLWYALSAEKQDEFNNRRAWTMMTALSVTWVTTAGRWRPLPRR